MLLKQYEYTRIDHRTWLHVPSGHMVHSQWQSPSSRNTKRDLCLDKKQNKNKNKQQLYTQKT